MTDIPRQFKGVWIPAEVWLDHSLSITEKGLRYGKNLTSPQSPRETQPHWYVDRFAELAELIVSGGAA